MKKKIKKRRLSLSIISFLFFNFYNALAEFFIVFIDLVATFIPKPKILNNKRKKLTFQEKFYPCYPHYWTQCHGSGHQMLFFCSPVLLAGRLVTPLVTRWFIMIAARAFYPQAFFFTLHSFPFFSRLILGLTDQFQSYQDCMLHAVRNTVLIQLSV